MKLKYYLRGLGIGIILTTIILMIAFSRHTDNLSNEEIIKRAQELGMIMPEDESKKTQSSEESSDETEEASSDTQSEPVSDNKEEQPKEPDSEKVDSQDQSESDLPVSGSFEDPRTGTDEPPSANGEEGNYTLVVSSGMVCRTICEELQENGVIEDAEGFRIYLGEVGYARSISVGTYELPYGGSFEDLYQILKAGPITSE